MEIKQDKHGSEIIDPKPMAVPLHWKKPLSLNEQIKRMVRTSLSEHAKNQGYETFEEANDFDCGDDDPLDKQTKWQDEADEIAQMEEDKKLIDSKIAEAQQKRDFYKKYHSHKRKSKKNPESKDSGTQSGDEADE